MGLFKYENKLFQAYEIKQWAFGAISHLQAWTKLEKGKRKGNYGQESSTQVQWTNVSENELKKQRNKQNVDLWSWQLSISLTVGVLSL